MVNGLLTESLSVFDRGLHYGDGIFETIVFSANNFQLWSWHIERLTIGCQRLSIPCPNLDVLKQASYRIAQGLSQGILKIVITRGVGGRGYQPAKIVEPTQILFFYPKPAFPAENTSRGVRLMYCQTRLAANPYLSGIKHLNCLPQVLASQECELPQYDEGLMLDYDGCIIEGTRSNLFVVQKQQLLTPSLTYCGVAGVMRRAILEGAKALGIKTKICKLTAMDLENADEIFICNSIIQVWPVKFLAGKDYSRGTVTQQLQHYLTCYL